MKQWILGVVTLWTYERFLFPQGVADFLTRLTPEQQQMAKVTCEDRWCFVFYPTWPEQK